MEERIIEQLDSLIIPIESLNLDSRNARKHPQRNIDSIKDSLTQFGQRKPIVVQKNGMIVRAGNGTLSAAIELGWTRIAAIVIDDDERTAQRYAIADNKTADLAEWDFEILSSLFKEFKEEDFEGLGWEDYEIEPLLKADWTPADVNEQYEAAPHEAIHKIYIMKEQQEVVSRALELYREINDCEKLLDGEIVFAFCQEYLDKNSEYIENKKAAIKAERKAEREEALQEEIEANFFEGYEEEESPL